MTTKTSHERYKSYLKSSMRLFHQHKSFSKGQALMNELYKWEPKLYFQVVNTDKSPYYSDNKIPEFLGYLEEVFPEE